MRVADLPDLAAGLGATKVAAARANARAAVLEPRVADAVAAAASRLVTGELADRLHADPLHGGGGIVVHREVNERLAAEAGVDPSAPGASQSTADVCHTAVRLALRAAGGRLAASAEVLERSLRDAAARFGAAPTLARTCLQDGLAVPASLLPAGAASAIARRRRVLDAALAPLDEVVLGATVVGTGDGAPDRYRAVVVDELSAVVARPLIAHPAPAGALQHGDDLLDLAAAVAALALTAAKVAGDLRLLSSGPAGGLGELRLPKVMEGSTFFVGKNNPVVAETVVAASARASAAASFACSCAARAELHLAGYDLAAGATLLQAIDALAAPIRSLATDAVDGAALDEERCAALAAMATATKHQGEPDGTR